MTINENCQHYVFAHNTNPITGTTAICSYVPLNLPIPTMDSTCVHKVWNNGVLTINEIVASSTYFEFVYFGCTVRSVTSSLFGYIIEPNEFYTTTSGNTSGGIIKLWLDCCCSETVSISNNIKSYSSASPIKITNASDYRGNYINIEVNCFKPDYDICVQTEESIIPFKVEINFEPISEKCTTTKFQDLVYKYTRQNLKITGFTGSYFKNKSLQFKLGIDIQNTQNKLIQYFPDYNERKVDCDVGQGLRDSINKCFYFRDGDTFDLFDEKEYILDIGDLYNIYSNFKIPNNILEDKKFFYKNSGEYATCPTCSIHLFETINNELFFSLEMIYETTIDRSAIASPLNIRYTSDRIRVNNISDFYNRLILYPHYQSPDPGYGMHLLQLYYNGT